MKGQMTTTGELLGTNLGVSFALMLVFHVHTSSNASLACQCLTTLAMQGSFGVRITLPRCGALMASRVIIISKRSQWLLYMISPNGTARLSFSPNNLGSSKSVTQIFPNWLMPLDPFRSPFPCLLPTTLSTTGVLKFAVFSSSFFLLSSAFPCVAAYVHLSSSVSQSRFFDCSQFLLPPAPARG